MKPAAKESKWLKEIRAAKGIKSKTLDEEPTLFDDVKWIWNAFQLLSETRDYGMGGALRVRLSDMQALLTMKGITSQDDIDLFLLAVSLLDSAWCDEHYREQEAKRETADKKRKNKR